MNYHPYQEDNTVVDEGADCYPFADCYHMWFYRFVSWIEWHSWLYLGVKSVVFPKAGPYDPRDDDIVQL